MRLGRLFVQMSEICLTINLYCFDLQPVEPLLHFIEDDGYSPRRVSTDIYYFIEIYVISTDKCTITIHHLGVLTPFPRWTLGWLVVFIHFFSRRTFEDGLWLQFVGNYCTTISGSVLNSGKLRVVFLDTAAVRHIRQHYHHFWCHWK